MEDLLIIYGFGVLMVLLALALLHNGEEKIDNPHIFFVYPLFWPFFLILIIVKFLIWAYKYLTKELNNISKS